MANGQITRLTVHLPKTTPDERGQMHAMNERWPEGTDRSGSRGTSERDAETARMDAPPRRRPGDGSDAGDDCGRSSQVVPEILRDTRRDSRPILTALPDWFDRKFGLGRDDEAKVPYSGLGALRSKLMPGGNLARSNQNVLNGSRLPPFDPVRHAGADNSLSHTGLRSVIDERARPGRVGRRRAFCGGTAAPIAAFLRAAPARCGAFADERRIDAGRLASHCAYTPHSLPATIATLLLDAGVDIRKVQDLLGHRHITNANLRQAAAQHGRQRQPRLPI
jgi:hypothetical protein